MSRPPHIGAHIHRADDMSTARWGKVDPDAAVVSLGVTIPLAIICSAFVLFMGWLKAPNERKTIGRRLPSAPICNSFNVSGSGRCQTGIASEPS